MTAHPKPVVARAWLATAVLASAVYLAALISHTVNWPYTDDHTATLGFLLDWHSLTTWQERLARLLEAHNEHRLIFNHLVELADVSLFGQVHFGHMVIVGNLCWALALATLVHKGRLAHMSWAEVAPLVTLGCALSQHDLMIWAMGSLQQHGQLAFGLLAAWAASQGRWVWSQLAALMAAGTGGGGFALFPALALFSLVRGHRVQAALSVALLLVCLSLHTSHLPMASEGSARLWHAIQHPLQAIGYTLCFLGSVGKSTQFSIVLGATLVCALMHGVWREKAMHKQPFFTMVAIWMLTCAALAALSRLQLGVDQARSTRYTPHAIVFLCSVGMLGVTLAPTPWQRQVRWRAWAGLCLLLWAVWLVHGWRQQADQAQALRDRRHVAPPSAEVAHQILLEAGRHGIFSPPTR